LTYGFGGSEVFNPVAALYQEALVKCPVGFDAADEVHRGVEQHGIIGQRHSLEELG
jgi:hypothetical protein